MRAKLETYISVLFETVFLSHIVDFSVRVLQLTHLVTRTDVNVFCMDREQTWWNTLADLRKRDLEES